MAKQARVKRAPPVAAPPRAVPVRAEATVSALSPRHPLFEFGDGGEEHRQFPRAMVNLSFDLWLERDGAKRFSATLRSHNLSVSGVFLESSFFVPVGTQLQVSFPVEEGAAPVRARATVIRQERLRPDGRGRSGMALRFDEFFGGSEVALVKLFVGEQLREFAKAFLQNQPARAHGNELDRMVDVLAAWELRKVVLNEDVWASEKDD